MPRERTAWVAATAPMGYRNCVGALGHLFYGFCVLWGVGDVSATHFPGWEQRALHWHSREIGVPPFFILLTSVPPLFWQQNLFFKTLPYLLRCGDHVPQLLNGRRFSLEGIG